MERKETLEPARHPSQPTNEAAGDLAARPDAQGLVVLAPPLRVLYMNERARNLLVETQSPLLERSGNAPLSRLWAISSSIEQTCGRIFQGSSSSAALSNPVEIKGLIDCLGPRLRGHGFLFHDRAHLQWVRAVLVFERAAPR